MIRIAIDLALVAVTAAVMAGLSRRASASQKGSHAGELARARLRPCSRCGRSLDGRNGEK